MARIHKLLSFELLHLQAKQWDREIFARDTLQLALARSSAKKVYRKNTISLFEGPS